MITRIRSYKIKTYSLYICTFDESEIPLYKEIGINALFLPQAFNPNWYNPIRLPRSQRFPGQLCFIGSIGGKWGHRPHMIQRVANAGYAVHATTIFDAKKVNQAYNMHDGVLNLGLYCSDCGDPDDLKGFGLQQRIFESIGAGQICITNEIPKGTNELFEHGKHVLYYNRDTIEDMCGFALDKTIRTDMQKNIMQIRNQHTYKSRLEQLISQVNW